MTAEHEDRARELLGYSPKRREKLAELGEKKRELLEQLKAVEDEIKLEKGTQYIQGRVYVDKERFERGFWRVMVKRIMPEPYKENERKDTIIFAKEKKELVGLIEQIIKDLTKMLETLKKEEEHYG